GIVGGGVLKERPIGSGQHPRILPRGCDNSSEQRSGVDFSDVVAGFHAGTGVLLGDDVDDLAVAALAELHDAVGLGEERVVAALADVESGMPLRAALTHDDRARGDDLGAVTLDAQTLRVGVTPVTR